MLAAALSFALGTVFGAALQRWGDGVRASGHLGTSSSWTEAVPAPGVRVYRRVPATSYDDLPRVFDNVLNGREAEMAVVDDDGEA